MSKSVLRPEMVLLLFAVSCSSSVSREDHGGRSTGFQAAKLAASGPNESDAAAPSIPPAPPRADASHGPAPSSLIVRPGVRAAKRAAGPSQLVVKFVSEGPSAVTECPERWMAEGRSFRDATADRSDSLDRLRKQTGVIRARALMAGRTGLSASNAKKLLASRLEAARNRFSQRSRRATAVDMAPATGRGDISNVYVLDLSAGFDAGNAAQQFARDPHVAFAQVNYPMELHMLPNDPYFASAGSWGQAVDDLWGLKRIGVEKAWDSSQGEGVVVGVVDTGLDLGHPDIAANVWTNADEIAGNGIDDDHNGFIDDIHGWNFPGNSADPTDDFGHGTHVAGTIAAIGNNALGVVGVAPRARIMPVKALDATGYGSSYGLAQAIVYAAQNGAEVINNSYGCSNCPNNPVVEEAVAVANQLGVVVVFSAGNAASDIANISPQNQPGVIVVAASDPDDNKASFSNFGFVDVTAPGGGVNVAPPAYDPFRNILSLKAAGCGPAICPPDLIVGGNYLRQAGTSMSGPQVAGLAALVLKQNPSYSPEEVRQVIRHSAADVATPGVDLDSGYGRIDAARALLEPRPLSVLLTSPVNVVRGSGLVDVMGTAQGAGLVSWALEYGVGALPTTFSQIASSSVAVSNGLLASWNLASVAEGIHTLRLIAKTSDGRSYEDRQRVAVEKVVITSPANDVLSFFRGDVATVEGTVAPADLVNYTLTVSHDNGWSLPDANITLANGGTRPVINGPLATWNTAGVPADQYTLTLTVNLASGGTIVKTTRAVVDPTLHAGWPLRIAASVSGPFVASLVDHLTAADVNGDGAAELVIGYGSSVYVLDHTGAVLPGWPQSVDRDYAGAMTQRAPAVGDVTGDGVPELAAMNSSGQTFVWQANGRLLPGWPMQFGVMGNTVAIADLDGDGHAEVVTSGYPWMTVFRSNATVPWTFTPRSSVTLSAPAIGDVDGDGKKEIAVAINGDMAGGPGTLYLLDSTGAVLPGWPQTLDPSVLLMSDAYPALGDLDGDGKLEVTIGSRGGTQFAFHHTGATLAGWPQTTVGTPINPAALGDLDGDGRLEIVAGGYHILDPSIHLYQEFLYSWRSTGVLLPGWPARVSNDSIPGNVKTFFGFGSPIMADLDGDGVSDVVVASDAFSRAPSTKVEALRGYRADGTVLPGFPKIGTDIGTHPTVTAAVADFDGDGKQELAWVDSGGESGAFTFYLWDLEAPATALAPWPMFQHDAAHTGCATPLAAPPTGLVAIPGDHNITLMWNASAGATRYNVFRSTTTGYGYQPVASGVTTNRYVDQGLSSDTRYYYVVTAANGAGSSGYSNEASAIPSAIPAAPTGLVATAGNTQVSLSWNASTGATSYNVLRSTTKGSGYSTVATGVTTTSYLNTGLVNGRTYYYVVIANGSGGSSGYSNEASATPKVVIPTAPTGLVATAGNTQVSLSWNASTGATSYNVLRSTTKGSGYTSVASGVTTTTYVNTGLVNGRTYYYVVTAKNSAGTSGYSNEASATPRVTAPPAPTNLVATAGNAQVSLSWSAATGATSYNVLRSTTSGSGYSSVATGVTATSYVNTGLSNGTTYYYVVTATNAGGTSGYSNQASAKPGTALPCTGAITVTGGQSGNFNTTGSVCYRTADTINGWGCSNFAGRTLKVNNVSQTCGAMPLPAKWSDGYRYFAISAGTYSWASFYWW